MVGMKLVERMVQGVIEEQQAARKPADSGLNDKGKKWLFRQASGNGKEDKAAAGQEEVEGMRVDFPHQDSESYSPLWVLRTKFDVPRYFSPSP